jgi:hypothetical protein
MNETRAERLLRQKAEHIRMVADTYRRSDQRAAGMRDDDADACDCGREALALLRDLFDNENVGVALAGNPNVTAAIGHRVTALLTRAGEPSQEDR